MNYFLEIIHHCWDLDFVTNFFDNYESLYDSLFYIWDIETEADDDEIENLVKKGIISKEDANILKVHKKDILIDLQKILNHVEEFNLTKRESIKLIWKGMKKYGLSDEYIKYIIKELYRFL